MNIHTDDISMGFRAKDLHGSSHELFVSKMENTVRPLLTALLREQAPVRSFPSSESVSL